MGGIGRIHERAMVAQLAVEAAGGFDTIGARHQAMTEALRSGVLGTARAVLEAQRNSLQWSSSEWAMRDLVGVRSFSSILAKQMETYSDNFTAMINGAIEWRMAAGNRRSLAERMHCELPHLYPELRVATAADLRRAPLGTLAERVLRDQAQIEKIRDEMLGLRSPWLDAGNPLRSVAAYTDARALMHLVNHAPANSHRVVEAVRQELGDYRHSEPATTEVSSDPILRTAFRLEKGFSPDLSSLPTATLVVVFSWLGFKTTADASADPEALQRIIGSRVRHLELRIRRFIENRMRSAFGSKWHLQRVSPETVNRWQRRRQTDVDNLRTPSRLFDYASFEDYHTIIERKDNWRQVFSEIFPVKSSLLEGLRRLSLIRNPDAHIRILTVEDMIDLAVEGHRIDQWISRAG
jgi:hypothetical protein